MSITADLLAGVAAELEVAGIAQRSDTGWSDGQTAITYSFMPSAPDRVVTLTVYRSGPEHPEQPLGRMNLQVRTRGLPGEPGDVDDLDDSIYLLLQGLTGRAYGSLFVIQVMQRSSLPMGVDTNDRWERSSNYALDVNYPPTQSRP